VCLHCAIKVDGALIILLHGLPECWYSWRHQMAALVLRFRVVAPDLRSSNRVTNRDQFGPTQRLSAEIPAARGDTCLHVCAVLALSPVNQLRRSPRLRQGAPFRQAHYEFL
jgi:pimeloyl-ACP methyl ester carboxylesterase